MLTAFDDEDDNRELTYAELRTTGRRSSRRAAAGRILAALRDFLEARDESVVGLDGERYLFDGRLVDSNCFQKFPSDIIHILATVEGIFVIWFFG
jgi:hypothetical protein